MRLKGFFDVALLVVVCALGLAISMAALGMIRNSVSASPVEKTALVALGDNTPDKPTFRGDEAILMLVVADPYTQYPNKIQFNDQAAVTIDADWFTKRESNINTLWTSYLSSMMDKTVSEFYTTYDGGQYRWRLELD